MIRPQGITASVLGLLIIGLLLPLGAGMLLTFNAERTRLREDLFLFQEQSLAALAKSTTDALVSFSPTDALNSANMLLNDERVANVDVYSTVFDMYLVQIPAKPPEEVALPRTRKAVISKNGEELGYVALTIDMGWAEPIIAREQKRALVLFGAMFLGAMALVIPAIYFKILRPLNRLTDQARRISGGDFDTPCRWGGRDEFSMLGRTLNTMRYRLKRSFNRVQNLARTDELTGIANRRAFFPAAQKLMEVCARCGKNACIAILDIDHFKEINDTYGHAKGDEVLIEIVRIVSQRIRQTDVFARFGGEEFILCLPNTDIENARVLMEEIRGSVASHVFPHGGTLTVSIGLAQCEILQPLDEVIARADQALYRAKSLDRNRTETFMSAEG